MTKLRFTKMHGLGNDFVVLDGIRQKIDLTPGQLRLLADRRLGVGCDQVLVVERATRSDVDFRYRIFNADGGEVEQCGNGARCFARFVLDEGLTDKREIRVETASGVIRPKIEASGEITVDMGAPRFAPGEVPFTADEARIVYPLVVAGVTRQVGAGYVARFYPAWEGYPTGDIEADVRRMNAFIEERVREMPEQYFWTHKRFKTRPPGEAKWY